MHTITTYLIKKRLTVGCRWSRGTVAGWAIARQLSLITCNFVARKWSVELSCRGIVQATHKRFSEPKKSGPIADRKDYPPIRISNKANNSPLYNPRGSPGRFNCALTGGVLWRGGAVNRSSTDGIFLGRRLFIAIRLACFLASLPSFISFEWCENWNMNGERVCCVMTVIHVIRFSIFNKWKVYVVEFLSRTSKLTFCLCNYLKMENWYGNWIVILSLILFLE